MSARIDLTGQRFGRLTVLRFAGCPDGRGSLWVCRCECGKRIVVGGQKLKNGHTRSCGCLQREIAAVRELKHGESRRGRVSSEYRTWKNMLTRCYNPKVRGFCYYGGRGINVSARWRNSFENFLADMGRKPTRRHSIDRINPDGDYSSENCRWATWGEQARNRRPRKSMARGSLLWPAALA
jgi:hypothetical protein